MRGNLRFIEWLEHTHSFADRMIMLDNGSTDGTLEVVSRFSDSSGKVSLIENRELEFSSHEPQLRSILWDEVRRNSSDGDWVLIVDSDEFHENRFAATCKSFLKFLNSTGLELVYFKFCDMWDFNHFRTDGRWSPFFPRLIQYRDKPFDIVATGLHESCLPRYGQTCRPYISDFRVKHYSIHTPNLRREKHAFYMKHTDGSDRDHADTIMSPAVLAPFDEDMRWPSVLLVSPIRNRDWILPDFLRHIEHLDYPTPALHLHFTCNNCDDGSDQTIIAWSRQSRFRDQVNVEVINFENANRQRDRDWNDGIIDNMSLMRNKHLKLLRESRHAYLFSLDSDVLLHPQVLKTTILQDKQIISPVFWAAWDGDPERKLPQCWQTDNYGMSSEWLSILRNSKTRLLCGGLGAQTLIHRAVAEHEHVNYSPIYNVSREMMWGEDRWFCIRAVCHGFELWCHTFTESIHIDKPSDLTEAPARVSMERWHERVFRQ